MAMTNPAINSLSAQRTQTTQLIKQATVILQGVMGKGLGFESVFAQAMAGLHALETDALKKKKKELPEQMNRKETEGFLSYLSVEPVDSSPSTQVDMSSEKELKLSEVSYSDYEEVFSENVFAQEGYVGGVMANAQDAELDQLNTVPLQFFIEKAVVALDDLSQLEFRANDLIDGYIQGTVTEDEVVIETAKLKLAMSMVTNIVQTVVQTFKEIQNIPV